MKEKRPNVRLSERQQVILAVLLVIFVATSMLYCVGLASIALRNYWESASLPWSASDLPAEILELPGTLLPPETIDTEPAP
jgi:hypothetical protein